MVPEATGSAAPSATGATVALVEAALALAGELDLARVREMVVAQAVALLRPDAAALLLPSADRPGYVIGAHQGFPASYAARARVMPGDVEAAARRAVDGAYTLSAKRRAPRWVRRLLGVSGSAYLTIVPLRHEGRLAGLLLLLYAAEESALPADAQPLVVGLARLAAGALVNAVRHRETEHGTAETTFLLQIAQLLNSTFDVATIAGMVVAEAADLMCSDLCALYLYDPTGQVIERLAVHGAPAGGMPARLALDDLPAVRAEAPRGRVVASEWPGEGDLLGLCGAACRVQASLTVPLRARGSLLGLIFLARRTLQRYNLAEGELGLKLAALAALALDNARLYANLGEQMQQLRSAQAQLIEAEKMASLGRIVAGVAHALNNPLATVSGYAQLMLDSDAPPEMREDLERIDRGARRAAEVVRELLAFARQRPLLATSIEVGDLVQSVLAREGAALQAANVEAQADIAEGLPAIRGDRNQLEQMLVHLVANARQAIAGYKQGGHVTISARRAGGDSPPGRSSEAAKWGYPAGGVRLAVRDDGPGIPADLLDKVFEPFLTTREVGQGMGLGLAVCYGVARSHGGRIWATNNPAGGATVYVELPAAP